MSRACLVRYRADNMAQAVNLVPFGRLLQSCGNTVTVSEHPAFNFRLNHPKAV